jgi:serine/threonine protein kinase
MPFHNDPQYIIENNGNEFWFKSKNKQGNPLWVKCYKSIDVAEQERILEAESILRERLQNNKGIIGIKIIKNAIAVRDTNKNYWMMPVLVTERYEEYSLEDYLIRALLELDKKKFGFNCIEEKIRDLKSVMIQLLEIVDSLEKRGIIHGNILPSNIIVRNHSGHPSVSISGSEHLSLRESASNEHHLDCVYCSEGNKVLADDSDRFMSWIILQLVLDFVKLAFDRKSPLKLKRIEMMQELQRRVKDSDNWANIPFCIASISKRAGPLNELGKEGILNLFNDIIIASGGLRDSTIDFSENVTIMPSTTMPMSKEGL